MSVTRRSFLKKATLTATAVGFPMIIPRHVLGGTGYTPPSEKVLLGMVGVGGQGRHNTNEFLKLKDAQIVAIADPAEYWDLNAFYYKSEAGRGPVSQLISDHYRRDYPNYKVGVYADFHDMLEQQPEIDGIVCSTPDHTHAYVVSHAMKAGKHVYCEKPLTHNLWENSYIRKLSAETGLATQMGNYGHSTEGMRRTVELLRAGVIGEVKEAHSWCHSTRWNKGLIGFPTTSTKLPAGFDWDMWLGPSESIPYHEYFSPVTWRDFWRFGTGALGDFGCHDMDAAVWAFNLKEPDLVQVYPGGILEWDHDWQVTPNSELGVFDFSAKGDQQALKLNWYSGNIRPPHHPLLPDDFRLTNRGILFEGSEGIIHANGSGGAPRVFPRELRADARKVEKSLSRSQGHFEDWIIAIKGGPEASGNFEYSTRLTEIVLTGVLSVQLNGEKISWGPHFKGMEPAGVELVDGRRIHWDLRQLKTQGREGMDQLIKQTVRPGWEFA